MKKQPPFIDIRIVFEKEVERFDGEDYISYRPVQVRPLASNIDLYAEGIAETAGQSDFYQIDVSNAILHALDMKTVTDL